MATKETDAAVDNLLADLDESDEVVEIDERGNIFRRGTLPRSDTKTMLRDQRGEY